MIPLKISLTYDSWKTIQFPINPEEFQVRKASNGETTNIINLGEINQPSDSGLNQITIESFFWKQMNVIEPNVYLNWLIQWQKSKKPALLVVTGLNYTGQVTCNNLEYSIRAGEEDDIYFKLDLIEYRPYGAKRINFQSQSKLEKILNGLEMAKEKIGYSVLIEPPKPIRTISKAIVENPFLVKNGDTISSIVRRFTKSTENWNELYNRNERLINEHGGELKEGMKLNIPESWRKQLK